MLRSLDWCCLEKVDLLVAAGSAVEVLPFSLSCPLPLLKTHPPFIASLLLFYSREDGSKKYSIRTAEGKPIFVREAGWKEPLFFFWVVLQLRPPAGTRQTTKKKEEGELKQRRKQKEAPQGDPEPKKGNQEKEKTQVEYRGEAAQDRRRRRKPGEWKETPNTRKRGGNAHSCSC